MCKEMQCQCSRRECAREKLEGQKVTEKTGVEGARARLALGNDEVPEGRH